MERLIRRAFWLVIANTILRGDCFVAKNAPRNDMKKVEQLMPETKLIIRNKVGLHARPAVLFVQAAQGFQSEIRVSKDGKEGNAKSFKAVLGLAGNRNDEGL